LFTAGHPFKGSWVSSIGYLQHPDMKKFAIFTPILFAPPNPTKVPGIEAAKSEIPSFANFFHSYFGFQQFNIKTDRCSKLLSSAKSCFENNTARPIEACSYYLDTFSRGCKL